MNAQVGLPSFDSDSWMSKNWLIQAPSRRKAPVPFGCPPPIPGLFGGVWLVFESRPAEVRLGFLDEYHSSSPQAFHDKYSVIYDFVNAQVGLPSFDSDSWMSKNWLGIAIPGVFGGVWLVFGWLLHISGGGPGAAGGAAAGAGAAAAGGAAAGGGARLGS